MSDVPEYVVLNRANWDERAPAHATSPDYAFERFRSDRGFLSGVVRFDRPRLGEVSGLRGVHLQCHIGTDTLSLHRLGARMSGLDFSPASLAEARALAAATGADIDYHEADVYDAVGVFGPASFDLVYTGIGALCWLPDVGRWAAVVAGLLRPGGRLFVRDGHPMLWTLDENTAEPSLRYPYYERSGPLVQEESGTYVRTETPVASAVTHSWNHGLGELVTALLANGLRLTALAEHDSVPWDALPGQMTAGADGEYRLTRRPDRLAASYTIQAVRE